MKFRKNHHPHTLVINGEHYSAVTGQTLSQHTNEPAVSPPRTRHIDGLHKAVGAPSQQAQTSHPPTPVSQPSEKKPATLRQVSVRSFDGPVRPVTPSRVRPQPIEARRLHQRHAAVSSPSRAGRVPAAPAKLHVSNPVAQSARSRAAAETAVLPGSAEAKARAARAHHIARSAQIQKFGPTRAVPAIASPPPPITRSAKASSSPTPKIENTHHRPPLLNQYDLIPRPGTSSPAARRPGGKIIGHKARLASISALGLSVLLVGGYIAYLNAPNLAVRIAASRSGVEAALPGYSPNGYRYSGPITYRPGSVVVNFRSDDGQRYAITQEESNWDSRSLLENVVARRDDNYRTFQEKGLTVYIYDGSNAAWVNDGIRYNVEGTASLQPEQLLRIAASL